MTYARSAIATGLCLFILASQGVAVEPAPPPTKKEPVFDTYHGVKVEDDYRWLENGRDPAVRKWAESENAYARRWLDAIPVRKELAQRLKQLYDNSSPDYFGLRFEGDRLFALKVQPPKNQPLLVVLKTPDDPASEQVVVDPNTLDKQGTTAMDFYVPSHDGRYVAVCLSHGGSEDGAVAVFEVDTGKRLDDEVPRVNYPTAGGSVAWNADSTGFYYTRYPQGNERPAEDVNFYQQIYFHTLGKPAAEDRYVLGKDFPRIAEIHLDTNETGRVLASVANGDGGEYAHYVIDADGKSTQVTKFEDQVIRATFGRDEFLYMVSRKDAPRGRVIRTPLSKPSLEGAEVLVPESEAVVQAIAPCKSRLYVVDLLGGPSQVRIYDLKEKGKAPALLPLAPISSVGQIVRFRGDKVLYRTETYTAPPAWYAYDATADQPPQKTQMYRTSPADFSNVEVVREFAVSKDGTKVPVNIIKPKGTRLDGNNPTVLYGYGGYGISMTPSFNPNRIVWLERGGMYAIANLRGGGEFGEEWHRQGNLTHKQNVFDDFVGCAKHLIERKYTRPEKLAIMGGSNGGLLMGAALTQHPELFGAVVSSVGIYDMLRVELSPNGAFNITEFGTVKDPAQFRALYAYSPYHHVKKGAKYPAVLMLTGDNDGRVDPYQSRKMTALLQADNGSDRPILLRYSFTSGHGMGTPVDERIAQQADIDAFLTQQLKVEK